MSNVSVGLANPFQTVMLIFLKHGDSSAAGANGSALCFSADADVGLSGDPPPVGPSGVVGIF